MRATARPVASIFMRATLLRVSSLAPVGEDDDCADERGEPTGAGRMFAFHGNSFSEVSQHQIGSLQGRRRAAP